MFCVHGLRKHHVRLERPVFSKSGVYSKNNASHGSFRNLPGRNDYREVPRRQTGYEVWNKNGVLKFSAGYLFLAFIAWLFLLPFVNYCLFRLYPGWFGHIIMRGAHDI